MRKIFTFLFAALMSVASMWAQEESLLTTLTFGESETYGETTSGVVSVTATNVYLYHGTYGWLLAEESSLSVTAKEGYTITKCVFRQNAKTPITDTEAPFEIHTNDWGGIIEDPGEEMNGVTSIEVYGYANAGGGSATTVVTITDSDFPSEGQSFTKDGVTVSAVEIEGSWGNLLGGGSFSTTLGNFTKIEVSANLVNISGEGWSGDYEHKTWTGNASSVSFSGDIYGDGVGVTLKFTIEPASTPEPEPEPAEVTVVFAANNKTVERTVTLPHTFKCSWDNGMDGPDELDIIIHELYNDYYYCNSNMNASGSDQVEVGTEEAPKNDYITIKGVFEGTATVTGDYFDWITGEEGKHNYSITISIKGSEPEPQPQGQVITWDFFFCSEVEALCDDGANIALNNSKDGITVTYSGYDDMDGMDGGGIWLYGGSSSKVIFSSAVGDISKIEVYYQGDPGLTPPDWTVDATNKKFVWEGTPAASVDLMRGTAGNIGFMVDHIVFTIGAAAPTAIENVQSNKAQGTKILRDGMLLIIRDGKIFNVTGAQVK